MARAFAGEDRALAQARGRLKLVGACFALAFASIGLRLVDMVEWQPAVPRAAATVPTPVASPAEKVLAAGRSDLVDRNGVVLATTIRVPGVYADPSLLPDKALAARRLAAVVDGVDAIELQRRFATLRRFAWVKHRITPKEQAAVLELGLPGVSFEAAEHRVYPKGRLAAHATGFVDIDNRGLAGAERALEARLRQGGLPVRLSLDVRVQQVVRDELMRAAARFHAIGANAIVMDRLTGELLAMVSLPDFDPNRVGDVRRIEYLNRNVGEAYELGSVFKIFSIAMALDSGIVKLTDRFDATGKLHIGRHRIGDDHAQNRVLSVPEIFQHSSNIGTARMAFQAGGAAALEAFFRKVGFYDPPEIELVETVRPRTPRRWADATVATTSFGHGLAVTPLQFVDAVAAIAGDGTRVQPTLLARQSDATPPRVRFVGERTAADMRWLLWLAVAHGTGDQAQLPTYLVGGKTGTAEKAIRGRYSRERVLASFLGTLPVHAPRFIVFAALDEPKGDKGTFGFRYGGWTVAPAVAAIIDRIGPLLGVPPTPPAVAAEMRARLERLLPDFDRQEAQLAARGVR